MSGCESNPIRTGNEQLQLPVPSFSELDKNGQLYHLTNIELSGYFNYSFENVALYRTKFSEMDEAVWIDFSNSLNESLKEETLERLTGKKIRIQGKFNSERQGHLRLFIGTVIIEYLEEI